MKKILLITALVMLSCGEESRKTEAITYTSLHNAGTFTDCNECHTPGGSVYENDVPLDFSTVDTGYATLKDNNATSPSLPTCSGIPYIASTPEASYLTIVLIEAYNKSGAGGKTDCEPYNIHLSDINVTEDEKSKLVSWIQGGAPK